MSDTPPVPLVPPVPPVPPVEPPPAAAVVPPPPPAVPEPARPNPYAQPGYAQPVSGQPAYAQPAYAQPGAPAYDPAYGYPPKTNTLAIVSLVLAFFVSLGAVICGHIALSQIKRTGEGGRGLAIAGLVIGYVGIAFGFLAVFLAIIASIASASYDNYN